MTSKSRVVVGLCSLAAALALTGLLLLMGVDTLIVAGKQIPVVPLAALVGAGLGLLGTTLYFRISSAQKHKRFMREFKDATAPVRGTEPDA